MCRQGVSESLCGRQALYEMVVWDGLELCEMALAFVIIKFVCLRCMRLSWLEWYCVISLVLSSHTLQTESLVKVCFRDCITVTVVAFVQHIYQCCTVTHSVDRELWKTAPCLIHCGFSNVFPQRTFCMYCHTLCRQRALCESLYGRQKPAASP